MIKKYAITLFLIFNVIVSEEKINTKNKRKKGIASAAS